MRKEKQMLWFTYEALDGSANEYTDTILAEDKKDAIKQIRERSLFPTKVKEIGRREVQENPELLSAWRCNQGQMSPVESILETPTQSYLKYLSDFWGDIFIEWGKILKGYK
jgi:type II secretory pathway component PulF